MKEFLFVFIGGGAGSICRHLFSRHLNPLFSFLPFGTLCANSVACAIFGMVAGLGYAKVPADHTVKLLIITGFCGGLSTFSTFNSEIFQMLKEGQYFTVIFYIVLSITICLVSFAGANFIFSK